MACAYLNSVILPQPFDFIYKDSQCPPVQQMESGVCHGEQKIHMEFCLVAMLLMELMEEQTEVRGLWVARNNMAGTYCDT